MNPNDIEVDEYPAPTWRKRLLVLLLAVATASTIVWVLTIPPTPVPRELIPPPADVQRCTRGQTQGCVGGMAGVIVQPAAVPASAPR
ncbi:MAG: hypothetical protein Q8R98_00590 [Rubrivivax sp.]|nr:hypothetical protein [Rubrivivax sp.]MDP3224600.1 hypothetical protein [Rubrivivax sp.]MDP3610326.1 hypothetical protein [Rubrivivax sp.]